MNTCDHNHQTTEEVRLLPIGGGGNVIVCRRHYESEMEFRRQHHIAYNSEWSFPEWASLQVYSEEA